LANGPSLRDVIPLLTIDNRFNNTDFIAVNFFAFDDAFFKIKPIHYCLSDPIFFSKSPEEIKVFELYVLFETRINWVINLYIPSYAYKKFIIYSKITNKYINIKRINTNYYYGFTKWHFFFYKKNIAMPCYSTVAIMAIFVGINLGYSRVYLYGVDHTFFDSLYVDDNNVLNSKIMHFYDNKKTIAYKPMTSLTGEPVKMSEFLYGRMNVFKGHDVLAKYAQFMNVSIINCTKNSLIDSYDRKIKP
jgi:hypothetical protein